MRLRDYQAGRDLGMIKAWLRVRGYIPTARKNDLRLITALRDAITGNPWTPPQPA